MLIRHLLLSISIIAIFAGVACTQSSGGDSTTKLPSRTPDLIKILSEGNAPNRKAAIDALGAKGLEAVDPLIAAMGNVEKTLDGHETDASQDRRKGAVEALAIIGTAAVPALGQALTSQVYEQRLGAIEALDKIGPDAAPAAKQLGDVFGKSQFDDERIAIIHALADVAPTDSNTIGLLEMSLMVKALRYHALRALGKIGPQAAQAVSRINNYLTDPDEQSRNQALMALQGIGPAEGVVPAVVGRLKDNAPRNRIEAAVVLGSFGPKGVDGVSGLVQSLNDTDPEVRRAIVKALGDIAPASSLAIDPLIGMLKDTDPQVRREAAVALGKFGGDGRKPFPRSRRPRIRISSIM